MRAYVSSSAHSCGMISSTDVFRAPQTTSTALAVLPSVNSSQLSPIPSNKSSRAVKYFASLGKTLEHPFNPVERMILIALISLSVSPVLRKSMTSNVMSGALSNAASHTSFAASIFSGSCFSSGTILVTSFQSFTWVISKPYSTSGSSSVKRVMALVMASTPSASSSDTFWGSRRLPAAPCSPSCTRADITERLAAARPARSAARARQSAAGRMASEVMARGGAAVFCR
mmetsp:Transcript_27863/g.74354  ORF Transcript_27863/g.74354 Transcript_27863/m.74354 type:complete len:229 (+) Transcript_27863:645-1331(+)